MKTMRGSVLAILLAASLLSVSGCAAKNGGASLSVGGGMWYDDYVGGDVAPAEAAEADGVFGSPMEDPSGSASDVAGTGTSGQQYAAGQLTCGVWSDFEQFEFWKNVINQNDFYSIVEGWGMMVNNRYLVTVRDGQGNPVYNAAVSLYSIGGSLLFASRTDVQGRAGLYYGYRTESSAPARITVTDAAGKVTEITDLAESEIEVTVETGNSAADLELLFMVDTTGSMGDELNYLSSELSDVISKVEGATGMRVSTSVNFYRDTGDEYLVRDFPFGTKEDAIRQIAAQSASGGGDYPEAVHAALQNAVSEHQWSANTVKLCILVLDAPPHESSKVIDSLHNTISEAAKQGIRVIPVVCSSGDDSTSLFCRATALLTGGEYLFLTSDSGIGGEHHVPMVGQYTVEYLNEALIRVIAGYCGTEIEIKPVHRGQQS